MGLGPDKSMHTLMRGKTHGEQTCLLLPRVYKYKLCLFNENVSVKIMRHSGVTVLIKLSMLIDIFW